MFHSAFAHAPASLQALRSVGLTDAEALSDLLSTDYDHDSFARDVIEAGALQQDCGFLPVLLRAPAEGARRSTIRIARLSEVQLCGELAVLRRSRGTTSTLRTTSTPTPPATSTSLPVATRARARHLKALEQLYRRVFSKRAKLQDACTDRQRSEAEDAVRRKWVAELKSFLWGRTHPRGMACIFVSTIGSLIVDTVNCVWTPDIHDHDPSTMTRWSCPRTRSISTCTQSSLCKANRGYHRDQLRPTLVLLAALEDYLHDTTGAVALRLQAWWHLVKAWAVLRHDDHGGLRPSDVRFDDEGMYGHLHRSKTTGGDKAVRTRPINVSTAAYIIYPGWLSTDFRLLMDFAPGERDFLLPSPSEKGKMPKICSMSHINSTILSHQLFRVLTVPTMDGWTRFFDPNVPLGHWREQSYRSFFALSFGRSQMGSG